MSTYNIKKIQLPNGDICNLRDDEAARITDAQAAYNLAASKTANEGTVTSIALVAGTGISIDSSTPITVSGIRTITNSGVRSVSASASNGAISVNTNGTNSDVFITGLKNAAFTNSSDYATAAQGVKADAAMPKSGGTFTGNVYLQADPESNLQPATKQYVDNFVSLGGTLATGAQIGQLTINGVTTTLYAPSAPTTIAVTQSANTPTIEFVVGTQQSATASLTGVLSTTTAISDGKIIYYLCPYDVPNAQQTLTLTYANSGTDTGAIPIYSYTNKRSVVPYPAGILLVLVSYTQLSLIASNIILNN